MVWENGGSFAFSGFLRTIQTCRFVHKGHKENYTKLLKFALNLLKRENKQKPDLVA